jgi:hemolysin III
MAMREPSSSSSASTEPGPHARPSAREELVHSLTHGLGAVAALVTLVLLVVDAASRGGALRITAAAVFGASLLAVYVSSTLYHAVPPRYVRTKAALQILDHAAIHLLIAGSCTPFALLGIGGTWGIALSALAWSIAALGLVVETTSLRHRARLSIGMYLGAGWSGALGLPALWGTLPAGTLAYLVLGGLAYTAGVPFFLLHRVRWMHAAWHGFVIAGSTLHALAIADVVAR